MPDKTLTVLVLGAIALSAAHDLDHLLRDDLSLVWAFAAVFLTVKYALIGAALHFYFRGKIGAAFWAVIGCLGAAALWFAHLSPGAEQRPPDIYAMYRSPAAGLIASGLVYAMMLSLVVLTLYGGWRAFRGAARKAR
ncbi:MAG: hypothetical protein AB7F41_06025 [Methylocystis sp.]|uniref:hypothetical protein n=1 Tax=Methylocystis sp. TaxID=1911079 RepID=UPI003D0A350D